MKLSVYFQIQKNDLFWGYSGDYMADDLEEPSTNLRVVVAQEEGVSQVAGAMGVAQITLGAGDTG